MTEAEWLTTMNVAQMGAFITSMGQTPYPLPVGCARPLRRQFIMTAVALGRLAKEYKLPPAGNVVHHMAMVTAEKFADGLVDRASMIRISELVLRQPQYVLKRLAVAAIAADTLEFLLGNAICEIPSAAPYPALLARVPGLIRCVMGNPFRPEPEFSTLRTPTSICLARLAYDDNDFSSLPILADALEDAGCSTCSILDHLHGPGPHARGCWVIDCILNRS